MNWIWVVMLVGLGVMGIIMIGMLVMELIELFTPVKK